MAFQVFVAGNVLTAAELNDYLMEQVNIICTSGTRPSSPAEGWRIIETDTDKEYTHNGTDWIQTGSHGASAAFTPTVTQSGTVTGTTVTGGYFKVGRMVTVFIAWAATASGTGGNAITFTVPFNIANTSASIVMGSGYMTDASTGSSYDFGVVPASATTVKFLDISGLAVDVSYLGLNSSSHTPGLASGDTIGFTFTYEATT